MLLIKEHFKRTIFQIYIQFYIYTQKASVPIIHLSYSVDSLLTVLIMLSGHSLHATV